MGIRKLKEALTHYYEVDIDNCNMTHENWINELAKAMTYVDYRERFLAEYDEYLKFIETEQEEE